jgi:hypothetical protein
LNSIFRHCERLALVATVVAVAGCAQAPPAPTAAPATPTAAPPVATPTTATAPGAAASPAVSPPAASPATLLSPAVVASPAVKPAASLVASPGALAAVLTPTPFGMDELSLIQPGLGTVMIEYARRMGNVWFAGQAGNWDMVHYQIIEMREIQETGEITRPPRAPALKAFESSFLDPLDAASQAQDKTQFETAYRSAIQGCNACHGSQTSTDFPKGFGFIKVQVPTSSVWDIYAWTPQ